MSTSFRFRLTGILMILSLPSCGLIKAPFKVAGAVVDGTAYVGKKAYDASSAPFKDTPEKKAAKEKEKKEKEAKEAKEKAAKEGQGGTQPAPTPTPALPQANPSPAGNGLPPPPQDGQVPSNDYLPPLPADQPPPGNSSVPYQR
ncbi:hypothetical protein [Haloferula sp. BvORR071]|uniref:hypothetical protein n=1 Tax=Haloferula sp. BvORR071 TaxID=1396141 RepID=UPI0005532813|nr:hypothetical protein [Haloferula sp. BvORR071]